MTVLGIQDEQQFFSGHVFVLMIVFPLPDSLEITNGYH
jgi:hypothetical protein